MLLRLKIIGYRNINNNDYLLDEVVCVVVVDVVRVVVVDVVPIIINDDIEL